MVTYPFLPTGPTSGTSYQPFDSDIIGLTPVNFAAWILPPVLPVDQKLYTATGKSKYSILFSSYNARGAVAEGNLRTFTPSSALHFTILVYFGGATLKSAGTCAMQVIDNARIERDRILFMIKIFINSIFYEFTNYEVI